jgi:hypothetical protein
LKEGRTHQVALKYLRARKNGYLRRYDRNNGASPDIRESRNIASAYDYKFAATARETSKNVATRANPKPGDKSQSRSRADNSKPQGGCN